MKWWKWKHTDFPLLFRESGDCCFRRNGTECSQKCIHSLSMDSLLWHGICWKSIYFLWLFRFIFHLFMLLNERGWSWALWFLLKLIKCFAKRGVWESFSWNCLHCAFGNLYVRAKTIDPLRCRNPIKFVNFTWEVAEEKRRKKKVWDFNEIFYSAKNVCF